jgi:amino acid transporter
MDDVSTARRDTMPMQSQRRRLGVPAVVLMIIAASAPMTVVAGGATTAYAVTSSTAVPIAYVVLGISLAIFAIGYAAMSRHINNAGAFYAYAAQGLGRPLGVGVSLIALVTYNCMQIGLYGILGSTLSATFAGWFGVAIPWWVWAAVALVIIGILGVNRIDLSAKVLGVLVSLEFLVVIVFDVVSFVHPTETFTAHPMSPAELFTPGIGAVLVFGVAAFMGFEEAAIYGEEAKDPKRTVARATFTAVIIIGFFYAVSTWALSLAVGPKRITSGDIAPDLAGPPLFFGYVDAHLAVVIVDIMHVLFITSVFAAGLSFHNAVARYVFSLGRERLLPRGLAKRSRSGVPWVGSLTQTILAIIVLGIFVAAGTDPVVSLFNWLTNTGAMGLVLLMTLISLSVIGYFWRDKRDAGTWSRIVTPIIAFVILATIYVLIFVNFNVLLGLSADSYLTFVFPLLLIAAGIVGIIWGLVLQNRQPSVYEKIGRGASDVDAELSD